MISLKYTVLITVFICCYIAVITVADWCNGGSCRHLCNCQDEKEICDKTTGACVSGCKKGWTGPGCTVMRCWYDDPMVTNTSSTCYDDKTKCPVGYMCVKRNYVFSGQPSWQGCCTKGLGPCHTATQLIFSSNREQVLPTCDRQGKYEPRQCPNVSPDLLQGCYCTLPNGNVIDASYHNRRDIDTVNCTYLRNEYMKEGNVCNIVGKWGKNCAHECICSDKMEQCERITGYCKSGCRSGYTGPGCQEIFKCWFGEPMTRNTTFNCIEGKPQNDCPNSHVCVTRRYLKQQHSRYGSWYGCCPNGKGPCDKRRQTIAPIDSEGGLIPPTCDLDGNYQPKQCNVFGCTCVFPNGTYIGESHHEKNCTALIQSRLGNVCDTVGKWGKNCAYQCMCNNDKEQCDRHTGFCNSGCRSGYTGPGCQEIFKCWFGEPVTRNSTINCFDGKPQSDCPNSHVCVTRRYRNLEKRQEDYWHGCCPNGKGPCDKRRQMIAPIDSEGDMIPPECDLDGNYQPKQCDAFGCTCVFPNSTYIGESHRDWKDSFEMNCTVVIQSKLGKCSGKDCHSSVSNNHKLKLGKCSGKDCHSSVSDNHKLKLGLIIACSCVGFVLVALILAVVINKVRNNKLFHHYRL